MLGILSKVISIIVLVFVSYQGIYVAVSLFCREKRRFSEKTLHSYAVLVCARNEEAVIGDLLASIRNQTYPSEKYSAFVMADNCSDRTAEVARSSGATVYERFDMEHVGKGYALSALIKHIRADFGDRFDGFLVFDADNVVRGDYLEQMNDSFCHGNRIIAGCVNSKNYGSNWLSAGSSLFLLYKSRFLNNARHILGLSAAANGTGFLFSREILDEWIYHTLTEDIEFSVDQACKGNRIAYCGNAVLYDEQPTSFKQSYYQRLRWAKGYVQVIRKYFRPLAAGIGRGSFSCCDMLNTLLSAYGLSLITFGVNLITLILLAAAGESVVPFLSSLAVCLVKAYGCLWAIGLLTTVTGWKLIRASALSKIGYTFTYPLFIATYYPIALCALFTRVTWVPIKHSVSIDLEKQPA